MRTRGASPGKHDGNLGAAAERTARDQHGVPGAALRLLQDGADTERLEHGGYLVGLMADDGNDRTRLERLAGAHDVFDQGAAAGTVQHFGQIGAQARALARRQDDDDKIGKWHLAPFFSAGCPSRPQG